MITTDVAVIGAGPAGLTAAIQVRELGAGVVLIDEHSHPGGQLNKQIHKFFGPEEDGAGTRGTDLAQVLVERAGEIGVDIRPNTVAWGLYDKKILALSNQKSSYLLSAQRVILATGATENVLAFPGWTLPGVMGAGAAQTMVNMHRVLPGKIVLMVGAGNVGLIVGYQLMQAGARIAAVLEVAPFIGGYGVNASKIARYGVPIRTSHTIREVRGDGEVEEAIVVRVDRHGRPIPDSEETMAVDTVCVATGLTPLTELAWIAQCEHMYLQELGGYVPIHSTGMETSVPGFYVCGDASGIEEATTAMEEGRIAGISAAEGLGYVSRDEANRRREECVHRIEALRAGPFGAHIAEAKRRLMTREGEIFIQSLSYSGSL